MTSEYDIDAELQQLFTMEMSEDQILYSYKFFFKREVNALQKQLKNNQQNPEKHPLFIIEWQKFSMQSQDTIFIKHDEENFDYDINLKWIKYWRRRMKELYEIDVVKKRNLRLKFPISDEQARKIEDEVLKENCDLSLSYENISIDKIEVVDLVSICKFLSKLSYELRFLVPKLVDLLYEAIEIEKKDRNSCDKILLEREENMNFLEMTVETLRSALSHDIKKIDRNILIAEAIKMTTLLIYWARKNVPIKSIVKTKQIMPNRGRQTWPVRPNTNRNYFIQTAKVQRKIFHPPQRDLDVASSSGFHSKPPEFWRELMAQNGNKNTKITFPNPYYEAEIISDGETISDDDNIPTVVSDYVPENNSISNDILRQQNSLQADTEMSIEDRRLIESLLNEDLNQVTQQSQKNNVIIVDGYCFNPN